MSEETLLEDIASFLRKQGYDVEEGQGEWPIEVHGKDGRTFGVSVIDTDHG